MGATSRKLSRNDVLRKASSKMGRNESACLWVKKNTPHANFAQTTSLTNYSHTLKCPHLFLHKSPLWLMLYVYSPFFVRTTSDLHSYFAVFLCFLARITSVNWSYFIAHITHSYITEGSEIKIDLIRFDLMTLIRLVFSQLTTSLSCGKDKNLTLTAENTSGIWQTRRDIES